MKEFMTLRVHMKASIRLQNPFEWFIILRIFFYGAVIAARFDAEPHKITVIHADVSATTSSDKDIEAFYSILKDALGTAHKKDIIIIGNWNAKIGINNTDWKSVMER